MGARTGTITVRTAGPAFETPEANIAGLFLDAVDSYAKPDALKYKREGAWHGISHRSVYDQVKRLALGLEALGLEPGDRVAILSENRPEWLLADFACVMAGAVSVPLYPVLPASQLEYMLQDSEARVVFLSEPQYEKVREFKSRVPSLEYAIVFGEEPTEDGWGLRLGDLLERGESLSRLDVEFRSRGLGTDPRDVLTILYTSGTTGRPKGVMLTHQNLVSNVRSVLQVIDIGTNDTALSVLPLCHIFERMVGHYVMFDAGATICYAESFSAVGDNMREVCPTVVALVPRGYEKIYAAVEQAAREGGPTRERILRWAIEVGGAWVDARLAGRRPGRWTSLRYRLADRMVFSKLRALTGGRIRLLVSGGAPLNPELARFFLSAGFTLLEGYGLTETSPVIAFNRPGEIRLRTVGKAIPGVEIAIAEDGEILTRGPHVMKGYYKAPEATANAIDADGWFYTGDIGTLEDGYLAITDRKKDLIVTAGGKNIAPQPIENRVQNSPYVSQAVMIGDRRRFPALLVVPQFALLENWARSRGIEFTSQEELVTDAEVNRFVEAEILGMLADLAQHERPKRVALLPRELSLESGEITPTLKVKRRVVETHYRDLIDSLYTADGS